MQFPPTRLVIFAKSKNNINVVSFFLLISLINIGIIFFGNSIVAAMLYLVVFKAVFVGNTIKGVDKLSNI